MFFGAGLYPSHHLRAISEPGQQEDQQDTAMAHYFCPFYS